jgi:hypothetical protein
MAAFLSKRLQAFLLITAVGCLEPYNPPEITDQIDILVVDGFLNATDNSASVRISKARPLSDDSEVDTGVSAFVAIEDEQGNSQPLDALSIGVYSKTDLQLSRDNKYRLSIVSNDGKRYNSDFVELTKSPLIDSISWKPAIQRDGIDIFVNTHDDSGMTKYFQWTYDETWEYTSKYGSYFRIERGVAIQNPLNVYRCWNTNRSSEIHVGSTTHLASNVIREFPLVFIPKGSQKVSARYSILVKQLAISKDAFDFWTELKKSTESLGGLFDPLPSQVLGNIHNADDASEPVLGYFSGGEVSEKRIFIRYAELPEDVRQQPILVCPVDSIPIDQIRNYPDMDVIAPYGVPFPEGYTRSSGKNCMDCRDDGGVLTRPEFWD